MTATLKTNGVPVNGTKYLEAPRDIDPDGIMEAAIMRRRMNPRHQLARQGMFGVRALVGIANGLRQMQTKAHRFMEDHEDGPSCHCNCCAALADPRADGTVGEHVHRILSSLEYQLDMFAADLESYIPDWSDHREYSPKRDRRRAAAS